MKFIKNNINKIYFIGFFTILVVVFVLSKFSSTEVVVNEFNEPSFFIQENEDVNTVLFSGFVKPVEEIYLNPETNGVIKEIFVDEGDHVERGQKIAQIENINQRLALKNAQVSYESAHLQLEKMKQNNNVNDSDSVLSRVSETQDSVIEAAKNNYFNTDLRAYPYDFDEEELAPVISGNYSCNEEGEYHIQVYSSNGPEGASFLIDGLETGRQTVSINYPVKLGNCGLEIIFNEDFSKKNEWIIPVPNTRSPQAAQAKKEYELALSGKKLALKQSTVDVNDIRYQEKLVSQAGLAVEAARIALDKTTLFAPVDGKIEELYLDVGSLVSPSKNFGRIISKNFEFVVEMPVYQRSQLSIGQTAQVTIGNEEHQVSISSFVDNSQSTNQSKVVKFVFDDSDVSFIGGEIGELTIELNQIFQKIPREFVGFGYYGPFIVCEGDQKKIRIHEEDFDFYWVDFNSNICGGEITLPHLKK